MVTRRAALAAIVIATAAAACNTPDYRCHSDTDCDVGVAGRCELDQRCTAIDAMCPSHRRYADHAAEQSGLCFDDSVTPANLCAAGQPPATPQGCAADVCTTLPSCCSTGWSEACVQQAQIQCSDVVCDTRIALTATKGSHVELWDLRWDGTTWTVQQDIKQTNVLAWLAPMTPADTEPQLASFMGGSIQVGSLTVVGEAGRNYQAATSVDFDRDGRPTAAVGYDDSTAEGGAAHLQIVKLDDGSSRTFDTTEGGVTRMTWADADHDAFPDGIAELNGNQRYNLLTNIEAGDFTRTIDDRVNGTPSGAAPAVLPSGFPAVSSFDWMDLDGDHLLDEITFGDSIDVHLGAGNVSLIAASQFHLDCAPPVQPGGTCAGDAQAEVTFSGAALPATAAAGGPSLVFAVQSFPPAVPPPAQLAQPAQLRSGSLSADTTPAPPPPPPPTRGAMYKAPISGISTTPSLQAFTFPTETCTTSDTAPCPPILAVVVRDLDGDHALDVIAIDGDLNVYTALSTDNLVLKSAFKVPTMQTYLTFVRTSTTGAPR